MPFMKGPAAWRRTLDYLNKGSLIFRDKVKVLSINYHETEPESEGLRGFVFWHLAQIKYKNPHVQCVQLKNVVKSPFLTFYTLNKEENKDKIQSVIVNCYKKNQVEIMEHCKELFGKSDKEIQQEQQKNEANFGEGCSRFCICQVEGQIACPRWKPLPYFMRGKYFYFKKDELEEMRKSKSDEQAMQEYWNSR
jgi:small subunit ribosomal protein S25